jgi:hypothetical protein
MITIEWNPRREEWTRVEALIRREHERSPSVPIRVDVIDDGSAEPFLRAEITIPRFFDELDLTLRGVLRAPQLADPTLRPHIEINMLSALLPTGLSRLENITLVGPGARP